MIAYGMLYTVAVGVPILLAALVGAAFRRKHGRPERGVWLLALGLTLTLPVLTLSRPPVAAPTAWTPLFETGVIALPALVPLPSAAVEPPSVAIGLADILIGLWLLASSLLAARWALSALELRRLSSTWQPETLDGVRVLLTPDLGPAVFGLGRPRVIVPTWVARLPPTRRALVLLHEQEHVRGGDHWLTALARIARIVTPWNPVVWLVTSRLRRGIEMDCDRRVLRAHPDVEAYGATLLMVSAKASRRLIEVAAFSESEVPLRRRILAMTTPPRALSAWSLVTTFALGVVLLSGALAVPVPAVRALQAQALPEPRVITDPTKTQVYFLRAWSLDSIRSPQGERAIVAPDGRWLAGSYQMPVVIALVGDEVVQVSSDGQPRELTRPPSILNPDEILRAIAEAYPLRLREQGLGGTVGMHFLVGATGAVQQTRIGQISAHRDLDEAALRVAEVYQFSSAAADGGPIAIWVSHAIDFRVP
jgi:TonB family protein